MRAGVIPLSERFATGDVQTGFGAYGSHARTDAEPDPLGVGSSKLFLGQKPFDSVAGQVAIPGAVSEIAQEYLAAGTQVLPTPTFGKMEGELLGLGISLEHIRAGKKAAHLLIAQLAQSAGVGHVFVVRQLGDCYRLLEEHGMDEQIEWFVRATDPVKPDNSGGGVTDIAAETLCLGSAGEAFVRAAERQKIPGSALNVSWYAEVRHGKARLSDGEPVEEAADRVAALAEELVGSLNSQGSNCTDPEEGPEIMDAISRYFNGYLSYHPNAFRGRPYDEAKLEEIARRAAAEGITSEEFLRREAGLPENLGPWLAAHEEVLKHHPLVVWSGGCCFVGPAAIRTLHAMNAAENARRRAASQQVVNEGVNR